MSILKSRGIRGRLKVSVRIYLGFGITLVLLFAVGLIGSYGLEQSRQRFDQFAQYADAATVGLEIGGHIAEVRRAAQAYYSTGEEAQNGLARKAMSDLELKLDTATTAIQLPKDLQAVKDIATGFAAFEERFGTFIEQQGSLNLLVSDTITPTGSNLVAKARALDDSAAQGTDPDLEPQAGTVLQNVVIANAAVSQFIASHDPDALTQANTALAAIQTALNRIDSTTPAPAVATLSAAIRTLKDEDAAALADYATQRASADTLFNETMTGLGKEIAEKADGLKEDALIDMAALRRASAARIKVSQRWGLALSAGALVIGMVLAWLIARGLIRPLVAMTGTMGRLARNDTSVEVPATGNRDEIGDMARAVLVFKNNAIDMDRMIARQEARKQEVEDEKRRLMQDLADRFDLQVHGVVQAVAAAAVRMHQAAETLSHGADAVNREATAVAATAEQTTSNVETVASAAEQLSSSIGEISRRMTQASEVTEQAVLEAEQTNAIVSGLTAATQRISEVVGMIDGVAAQTNLLALNATIEAARAGEAGKGFSVVANEVKILANQTAHATAEITQQIQSVQKASANAVTAIHGMAQTIAKISQISTAITAAVEEQRAVTSEIARNVDQAASGTRDVSLRITGIMQGAERSGSAASDVLGAATELSGQSARLDRDVTAFITRIRTT
ncbi:MAG: methyl-accepting chemotaxis protein [Azospirillaceae bacterium]|nr:methyl-accepting chemotaxis protein [Azospirillaceae bacterium]